MARPAVSFNRFFAITTSDTVDLERHLWTDAVYIGGTGNVAAVMFDGSIATFTGALVGSILPIQCKRINATLTTATGLIGLKQQ